jgi:hypothetical protein
MRWLLKSYEVMLSASCSEWWKSSSTGLSFNAGSCMGGVIAEIILMIVIVESVFLMPHCALDSCL